MYAKIIDDLADEPLQLGLNTSTNGITFTTLHDVLHTPAVGHTLCIVAPEDQTAVEDGAAVFITHLLRVHQMLDLRDVATWEYLEQAGVHVASPRWLHYATKEGWLAVAAHLSAIMDR